MPSLDRVGSHTPWRVHHPGEKGLLALAIGGLALLAPAPAGPGLALATTTLLALGPARVPFRVWTVACALPMVFTVSPLLAVALTADSDGVHLAGASAYTPLLRRLGRTLGAVSALVLLTVTTPVLDWIAPLRRLGISAALLDIATAMHRLIAVGIDVRTSLVRAHTARSGSGWINAHASGRLAGALLVRTVRRARNLEHALEMRGTAEGWALLPLHRPFRVSVAIGVIGLGLLLALLAGAA